MKTNIYLSVLMFTCEAHYISTRTYSRIQYLWGTIDSQSLQICQHKGEVTSLSLILIQGKLWPRIALDWKYTTVQESLPWRLIKTSSNGDMYRTPGIYKVYPYKAYSKRISVKSVLSLGIYEMPYEYFRQLDFKNRWGNGHVVLVYLARNVWCEILKFPQKSMDIWN